MQQRRRRCAVGSIFRLLSPAFLASPLYPLTLHHPHLTSLFTAASNTGTRINKTNFQSTKHS